MRKISVLLENEEYDKFETYCRDRGHKKSTLISKVIRDFLKGERSEPQQKLFQQDKQGRE